MDLNDLNNSKHISDFIPEGHLIGMHTNLLDRLEAFNSLYSINLEIKKTFHWKNGMYNKIREKTVECILPWLHNKPRGSHNITAMQQHRYNNFRTELLAIENEMANKRWEKYILGDETDTGEDKWNNWVDALMTSLLKSKCIDKIEIPKISTEFYGRRYRNYRQDIGDCDRDETPYIRFTFHLDNIVMQYKKYNENIQRFAPRVQHLWGDMDVHFEVDLYYWINTLGNSRTFDRAMSRRAEKIATYIVSYPLVKGTEHPYIKSDMSQYMTGNVCFGDLRTSLLKMLHGFKFDAFYATLGAWASQYNIDRTTPLHNPYFCMVGLNLDNVYTYNLSTEQIDANKQWMRENWRVDTSLCRRVAHQECSDDATEMREIFCISCQKSGLIEGTTSTCETFTTYYAEDAIDTVQELRNLLIEEFDMNPNYIYRREGREMFFGLDIQSQADALQRRLNSVDHQDLSIISDTERILLSQIERAKLIAQYGIISNWHHQGANWYYDGISEHVEDVDYGGWSRRFVDNSNEFLILLIEKQIIINNERNENNGIRSETV